jgi:hypothetical protein
MGKYLFYGGFTAGAGELSLLHIHAREPRHQFMEQGNRQDQKDMHKIA